MVKLPDNVKINMPCTNVGNCDRSTCRLQHVDDKDDEKIIICNVINCDKKCGFKHNEEKQENDNSNHLDQSEDMVRVEIVTHNDKSSGVNANDVMQLELDIHQEIDICQNHSVPDPAANGHDAETGCVNSALGESAAAVDEESEDETPLSCANCKEEKEDQELLRCSYCNKMYCAPCEHQPAYNMQIIKNSCKIGGLVWLCTTCNHNIIVEHQSLLDELHKLRGEHSQNQTRWEAEEKKLNNKVAALTTQNNRFRTERKVLDQNNVRLQHDIIDYKHKYEMSISEMDNIKRNNGSLNSAVETLLTTMDKQQPKSNANQTLQQVNANMQWGSTIPPPPPVSTLNHEAGSRKQDDNISLLPSIDEIPMSALTCCDDDDIKDKGATATKHPPAVRKKPTESPGTMELKETGQLGNKTEDQRRQVNDESGQISQQNTTKGDKYQEIFIGNLPPDATKEKLQHYFSIYINSVNNIILKETRRTRYAICSIKKEDVQEILRFNNITLNGHKITIERARQFDNKNDDGQDSAICTFYLQGRCKHGRLYNFEHPPECRFYAKGRCNRGDACQFAHIEKQQHQNSHGAGGQNRNPRRRTRNNGQENQTPRGQRSGGASQINVRDAVQEAIRDSDSIKNIIKEAIRELLPNNNNGLSNGDMDGNFGGWY